MARSTRNDAQWQSALTEQGLRDLGEPPLNLGHAGLRKKCYSGQRLRSSTRRCTPLHRLRPLERAEPRFTPENCEFL